MQLVSLILIHGIDFYLVDSAIQRLNNGGLVTSWLTVTLSGGLVSKDGGHSSHKDLWVFSYAHVQDGSQGECEMVSSLFLLK